VSAVRESPCYKFIAPPLEPRSPAIDMAAQQPGSNLRNSSNRYSTLFELNDADHRLEWLLNGPRVSPLAKRVEDLYAFLWGHLAASLDIGSIGLLETPEHPDNLFHPLILPDSC
jgi:hypothetical protein